MSRKDAVCSCPSHGKGTPLQMSHTFLQNLLFRPVIDHQLHIDSRNPQISHSPFLVHVQQSCIGHGGGVQLAHVKGICKQDASLQKPTVIIPALLQFFRLFICRHLFPGDAVIMLHQFFLLLFIEKIADDRVSQKRDSSQKDQDCQYRQYLLFHLLYLRFYTGRSEKKDGRNTPPIPAQITCILVI